MEEQAQLGGLSNREEVRWWVGEAAGDGVLGPLPGDAATRAVTYSLKSLFLLNPTSVFSKDHHPVDAPANAWGSPLARATSRGDADVVRTQEERDEQTLAITSKVFGVAFLLLLAIVLVAVAKAF